MKVLSVAVSFWLLGVSSVGAFAPSFQSHRAVATTTGTVSKPLVVLRSAEGDDEDKPENPYQDPNYPELEFVNYADPEYQVDQGVGDEFFDPESTEEKIEAMREERRMRNDEFQFETYYKEILKEGEEYKGEWTVYYSSTFLEGVDENPLVITFIGLAAFLSLGTPNGFSSTPSRKVEL